MRWQSILSKKELAHLRWSRDGAAPSLQAFRELRVYQNKQDLLRSSMGLNAPSCHECNVIEAKLQKEGKI